MSCKGVNRFLAMALLAVVSGTSIAPRPAAAEEDPGRKIKTKVTPNYPQLAKRMNVTGTVKLEVIIGPSGIVKTAKVIGGHPLLIEPAVDAVKQWRYEPAQTETVTTVEFHFTDK